MTARTTLSIALAGCCLGASVLAREPAAPEPHAASGAAPAAPAVHGGDSLVALRQKLAERLGATPPVGGAGTGVMRVSGSAGTNDHGTSVRKSPARSGHQRPTLEPTPAPSHGAEHGAHWGYDGAAGPEAWAQMKPEFRLCAIGNRQSPIDIRGGIQVDLAPIEFDYHATGFSVLDNGHTVQINLPPGNAITVLGRRYDLVQFHFHRPSEERVEGRPFDMDIHLVHKDPQGRLAVVAVLLQRGAAHPVIQTLWNALPLERNEELPAQTVIDPNKLLPEDRRYFTYMGSLTTPPCTEGVLWMVMKQPVQLAAEQIGVFSHLYPMNARPVQQTGGRLIKASN